MKKKVPLTSVTERLAKLRDNSEGEIKSALRTAINKIEAQYRTIRQLKKERDRYKKLCDFELDETQHPNFKD
jgi:flagellar biosynthesis chaperone FliJ